VSFKAYSGEMEMKFYPKTQELDDLNINLQIFIIIRTTVLLELESRCLKKVASRTPRSARKVGLPRKTMPI
jgi:hypothetical protein